MSVIYNYAPIRQDLTLAYKHITHGDKRPTVVVFPGGPGMEYALYETHTDYIEPYADLLYFDPAGCGDSSTMPADYEYTIQDYVYNVKALIDYLAIDKVIILGTSFGGMAALHFALYYPLRCQSLILVATAASYHFLDTAQHWVETTNNITDEQRQLCRDLFNGAFQDKTHLQRFLQASASLYAYTPDNSPYAHFNCAVEPLNYMFRKRYQYFDLTAQLPNINVPTLILAGADDWIIHPQYPRTIAQSIPNTELHILEHCSHAVAKDRPEFYWDKVPRFIEQQSLN